MPGLLTHARPWEVIAQVASYHFKRFPILGAAFTPTGDQALPQCVLKELAKNKFFDSQRLQNLVSPGSHDKHHQPNLGSAPLTLKVCMHVKLNVQFVRMPTLGIAH